MKFTIQKNVLQDALQAAISAVPNKSTIQILNNFSLRLEGNFLEVSATDLDLGIRVKVEVQGERDGAVVINARKLFDQVKSLVDPSITNITFDAQDYLVKIQWSERGKASIIGFDANDFPPFPEIENGETLNIAASELAFLAEKTLFATSTDSTRLSLNGVFLEAKVRHFYRLHALELERRVPRSKGRQDFHGRNRRSPFGPRSNRPGRRRTFERRHHPAQGFAAHLAHG